MSESATAAVETPSQSPTEVPEYVALCRLAFEEYRSRALWNMRMPDDLTAEGALAIARALRIEGNMKARFLAERIERACRAAV